MDTIQNRKATVARILRDARLRRAVELGRDVSKVEHARWLGISDKTYDPWEEGTRLPKPEVWGLLIERFGPEMAMALGIPPNVDIEALKDPRFAKIAADWPAMTDRQREILIAIAKRTARGDPRVERFFNELERAVA